MILVYILLAMIAYELIVGKFRVEPSVNSNDEALTKRISEPKVGYINELALSSVLYYVSFYRCIGCTNDEEVLNNIRLYTKAIRSKKDKLKVLEWLDTYHIHFNYSDVEDIYDIEYDERGYSNATRQDLQR